MFEFGAFDQTENHQPLHHGIVCVDRLYDAFLTASKGCQSQSNLIQVSTPRFRTPSYPSLTMSANDNDSHLRWQ